MPGVPFPSGIQKEVLCGWYLHLTGPTQYCEDIVTISGGIARFHTHTFSRLLNPPLHVFYSQVVCARRVRDTKATLRDSLLDELLDMQKLQTFGIDSVRLERMFTNGMVYTREQNFRKDQQNNIQQQKTNKK